MLISKFPNKGSPFDKIPILIIKKISHIQAPVISELLNMSIMEGVFPSCLKTRCAIPTLIFKKMSHIPAPVISELFNMSIMEGVFPSCLEAGRVIPIFKSGKKDQTTNYRPITTLPILAKIFEKLAHKIMICFINRFNLLNSNQFRFLAGQNTSEALTELLDKSYDAINLNRVLLKFFSYFCEVFSAAAHKNLQKTVLIRFKREKY